MSDPILYSFRRCPYAMRARLALASAGVSVEIREILLRDKPAEMLEASTKGTVPVVIFDGNVIDESHDIMVWALDQNDPENLLARHNPDLVAMCEGPFKDALDKYKYATRYDGIDPVERREYACNFLRLLETQLVKQIYLSGDQFGFTDMATVTFVRQFANVDRTWFDTQNWPNLINWLENFLSSPRFASIMVKYPVWQPKNPPIYFPESP